MGRLATAVVAAMLALGIAAYLASADDAGPLGNPDTLGGEARVDTDYTPVAKDSELWHWVAGARFGRRATDSITPDDVDFFSVRFYDEKNGFAGGSQCLTPPSASLTQPELDDYLTSCRRGPVLYRYTDRDPDGPRWTKVVELPGADRRGYIGAVAWLSDTRVLAVGGDGRFPRRELPRAPGESDAAYAARDKAGDEENAAGMARAWLLENGQWRELSGAAGELLPGMRGMTALDADPRRDDFAFAGAYAQIWQWNDGAFNREFSAQAGAGIDESNRAAFRFRVRDLRFAPGQLHTGSQSGSSDITYQNIQAAAVTSGCCAEPSDHADSGRVNSASLLLYDVTSATWFVVPHPTTTVLSLDGVVNPSAPESLYSVAFSPLKNSALYFYLGLAATSAMPAASGDAVIGEARSTLCTIKLRRAASESDTAAGCSTNALTARTSTLRLVSIDSGNDLSWGQAAIIDWGVGELASSGQGMAHASRGIQSQFLVDTPPDTAPGLPDTTVPAHCEAVTSGVPNPTTCQVDDAAAVESRQRKAIGSKLYRLDSYALNSVDMVADTGVGWAVGDRGAIERVGGGTQVVAGSDEVKEPSAPQLGAATEGRFPDSSVYAAFQPVQPNAEPGRVPPLEAQPLEPGAVAQLVPAGSPNPTRRAALPDANETLTSLVMSRDGAEGWAAGAAGALYHFDGVDWRRCDMDGVRHQLAPDPACASVAEIRHATTAGVVTPQDITALTRIPTENDDDPSNDDDFEVIAVGGLPTGPRLVMRYARGRWAIDRDAIQTFSGTNPITDVVFAAPDDGWLLRAGDGTQGAPKIYHYGRAADGSLRWTNCADGAIRTAEDSSGCGDPGFRLPLTTGGVNDSASVQLALAGKRVYLSGSRTPAVSTGTPLDSFTGAGNTFAPPATYPMIIYRDPDGSWRADAGGYDPGCVTASATACIASGRTDEQGQMATLAVARTPSGAYQGWAVGQFGGPPSRVATKTSSPAGTGPRTALLRLDPGGQDWAAWTAADAGHDYLFDDITLPAGAQVAALPDGRSFIAPSAQRASGSAHPLLHFTPAHGRWEALSTPFVSLAPETPATGPENGGNFPIATVQAVAADGSDGLWVAAAQRQAQSDGPGGSVEIPPSAVYLYHYTDRVHRPVFSEVAQPIHGQTITAAAGAPDGSLWVGTDSSVLHRYDRLVGWTTLRVPGWNTDRATASSPVRALALDAAGRGVAVGAGGRIADLRPTGATLNRATGKLCELNAPVAPCSTGHDLLAAAVAADGSAMVGGANLTLLWRPSGGDFRAITMPSTSRRTTITGVALPTPTSAWIATSRGQVFAGRLEPAGEAGTGRWSWSLENLDSAGRLLTIDPVVGGGEGSQALTPLGLTGIAVDAGGRGLAVGPRGVVLERGASGWRRLETDRLDNLTSVVLGPRGLSQGALVGGENGLILTLVDGRLLPARHADVFDGLGASDVSHARVVGLALSAGSEPGQIEAWAAVMGGIRLLGEGRPGGLLHYASDGDDPLLNPDRRVAPLPDAPDPRPGETVLAAFGKSDCPNRAESACAETSGTGLSNELIAQRVAAAIAGDAGKPGGPTFALFTGDAADTGGQATRTATAPATADARGVSTDVSSVHHRWNDLVAQPLMRAGVPVFAAIGTQDLTPVRACSGAAIVYCRSTSANSASIQGADLPTAPGAVNLPWRAAFASMPAPWGSGAAVNSDAASFTPVGVASTSVRQPDVTAHDPTQTAADVSVQSGGAATHYAFDVRAGEGHSVRVVVLDTSQRSLQASDVAQNPAEPGGQLQWAQSVLCVKGSAADTQATPCTRSPDEPAIVLSTMPTYSYGPGALTDTATDGSSLESLLLRNQANVLVAGHIGWNGMYYALDAGLHDPCPGGTYPAAAPDPAGPPACGQGPSDSVGVPPSALARALSGTDAPAAPIVEDPTAGANGLGLLPVVVASGAGGKFSVDAQAIGDNPPGRGASNGFWHGYTLIRVDRSGDPRLTIVEQRPVFDWISLETATHVLHPGQKLTLRGYGREPVALDLPPRYDVIDSPAITHRFDLLEADPERPYVPRRDANGEYVALDPSVGTVDPSGRVLAARGNHGRVYAIAVLSVGGFAAATPLVFEPRRSYLAPRSPVLAAPRAPTVRVLGFSAQTLEAPPSAPPAATPPPISTSLDLPAPPALPSFPPASPSPTTPVAPPAPPAPPGGQHASPLSLSIQPVGVAVPPSTGVTAQPTPPVQPAPPSGARREAKQRQAATAKSEEGASENAQDAAGDLAGAPPSNANAMTRRDRVAPAADGFTPLSHARARTSLWATELYWGGGSVLLALSLALVYTTARPSRRRRSHNAPAPAFRATNRRNR